VRALFIDALFTLDGVVHLLGSSAKVLHCTRTAALSTKGLGVSGMELERGAERVVEDVGERGPVSAVEFLAFTIHCGKVSVGNAVVMNLSFNLNLRRVLLQQHNIMGALLEDILGGL